MSQIKRVVFFANRFLEVPALKARTPSAEELAPFGRQVWVCKSNIVGGTRSGNAQTEQERTMRTTNVNFLRFMLVAFSLLPR